MKKFLIWVSLMAFLGAGCAGTANIQKAMRMRSDELKYEYDIRTAEKKGGTLEVRSFIVDDVLPLDTTVTRTSSLILPLILINFWHHEFQCNLGYNQIVNDYKQFMRESFIEEVNRSSAYMYVENQGALAIDIIIRKIEISASITRDGGFLFIPIAYSAQFGAGTGFSANPVDIDVQAEVVLRKGETTVFTREFHGIHNTTAKSVIIPPEYTTVMIEGLSMAIKNLNAKIVKAIKQKEITVETLWSQYENMLTRGKIATSSSITGDTYKDPVTGMEFVFVKGGCYLMGNNLEDGEKDEIPAHEVCVDDFYMGKYGVTQGQWKAIMGNNPSKKKIGTDCPVNMVSWEDAHTFALKMKYKTGFQYRLPTEAEWEYAARGIQGIEKPTETGSEPSTLNKPIDLGAYDIAGNMKEWISDWYDETYYQRSPKNNPKGPQTGEDKVLRGGPYKTTHRDKSGTIDSWDDFGFRMIIQIK